MSDIPAIRRSLKIKTGVVRRLAKERGLYQKETEAQMIKLDKTVAAGEELEDWEWKQKNEKKLLEESNKMVIDVAERLGKATIELRNVVVEAKKEEELIGSTELTEAEEVLEQTNV